MAVIKGFEVNNTIYYYQDENIAKDFSENITYNVGDYVFHDGTLYRFTADHAAGAWIGTDAVAAITMDDMVSLRETLYDTASIAYGGTMSLDAGDFEQGQWNYSKKAANAKCIRCNRLIPVTKGSVLTVLHPTLDLYIGRLATPYSTSNEQNLYWTAPSNDPNVFVANGDGYLTIILRGGNNSGEDITVADYDCTIRMLSEVVGTDIYNGKDRTSNYQYGMTYFRPTDAGYSSDNKMSTANIPVNSLCYASGAQLQHGTDETFPTDLNNSKYYWIFCWSNTRLSTSHGSGRGYILIASDFSKYVFGYSGNSGTTTTWHDLITPIDDTLSVEGAAAESSAVGGALYLTKNRNHNWASGFTWWSPFAAGWSAESNPKLTPLDIPANTICQLAGDIMNTTAFPEDISYAETSYYLTICLKNLQTTNDIRYYILIPTRSNKIYHGIKSASLDYVIWSKDYIEIDDSLSVSGKAADAKAVGDYIYKNNIAAPLKLRTASQTSSRFTWTYNDGAYNVIGENPVPSGGIAYNLVTKQVLPSQIRAGGELYIEYETSDPNVYVRVMTYDSNDNVTYLKAITKSTVVKLPSNAQQILIRLGASEGTDLSNGATIYKVNVYKTENINNIANQNIKILFIGNSYTHDCAEYFPFVFNEIAPECQITCGIAFHGGASLNDYLGWFDDGTAALDYAKYKTTNNSWDIVAAVGSTHTEDNVTVKYVLNDEPWDIVVIQQVSTLQGTWASFSNMNLIIDKYANYIRTQHRKSCRFGYLMPQLRFRPNSEPNYLVSYADQQECIQKILETTPVDFIIPCGTAIENARGNTTLNAIGNGAGGNTGHLVCDNNGHLQQGLAELIPAYVVTLKMFDLLGKPYGIMGDPIRPTQDVVDAWDVPGKCDSYPAIDTSQGVTDANCLLAQRCAIAAIKNPYEITQI